MASSFNPFLLLTLILTVTAAAAAQIKFDSKGLPLSDVPPVVEPRAEEESPKEIGPPPVQPGPAALSPSKRFEVLNSNRIHVEGFQSIERRRSLSRRDVVLATEGDGAFISADGLALFDIRSPESDAVEGSGNNEGNNDQNPDDESIPPSSSPLDDNAITLSAGVHYDAGVTNPRTTQSPQPEFRFEEEELDDWSDLNLIPREEEKRRISEGTNAMPETKTEDEGNTDVDDVDPTTVSSIETPNTVENKVVVEPEDETDKVEDWDFSGLLNMANVDNEKSKTTVETLSTLVVEDSSREESPDQPVEATVPWTVEASINPQPTLLPSPPATSNPNSIPAFGESKVVRLLKNHVGFIVGFILGIPAAVVICYFIYVKLCRRHSGTLNVSTTSLSSKKRHPSEGTSFAADASRRTVVSEVNELQISPNGKGPRPPPLPHKSPVT